MNFRGLRVSLLTSRCSRKTDPTRRDSVHFTYRRHLKHKWLSHWDSIITTDYKHRTDTMLTETLYHFQKLRLTEMSSRVPLIKVIRVYKDDIYNDSIVTDLHYQMFYVWKLSYTKLIFWYQLHITFAEINIDSLIDKTPVNNVNGIKTTQISSCLIGEHNQIISECEARASLISSGHIWDQNSPRCVQTILRVFYKFLISDLCKHVVYANTSYY